MGSITIGKFITTASRQQYRYSITNSAQSLVPSFNHGLFVQVRAFSMRLSQYEQLVQWCSQNRQVSKYQIPACLCPVHHLRRLPYLTSCLLRLFRLRSTWYAESKLGGISRSSRLALDLAVFRAHHRNRKTLVSVLL